VPADVQKGPQLSVARPGDDDRHMAGAPCEEGARLDDLALVPDVLPGPPEDRLLLAAQDLGVEIPIPGECAFHCEDDISVQCVSGPFC
jgi:hypothetical protein